MSNHTTALVPLATSEYQTPELFYKGNKADTGLFAESLIYYDTLYVHAGNSEQFADFISKLIQQGLSYEQLIELIENGSLKFIYPITSHAFCSRGMIPGEPGNNIIFSFHPFEEESIKKPNYFEKTFLDTDILRNSFSGLSNLNEKAYNRFCEVSIENSLVFDGESIATGLVDNAYEDFLNPERYKLIVKSVLIEIYKLNGIDEVPDFDVRIRKLNYEDLLEVAENSHSLKSTLVGRNYSNGRYEIYEVDSKIPLKGIKNAEQHARTFRTLPLSCAGLINTYIRSAGILKCDFFLPNPVSQIIGNKLYEINDFEISKDSVRKQNLVDKLENIVRFPDLHSLINQNQIDFNQVLKIRKKAKKMREWLQQTDVDLDSDFQIFEAYLNEAAKESGFTKNIRRSLHVFGFVASTAIGGLVGHSMSDNPLSTTVGAATGSIANEVIKQSSRKLSEKLFDYGADIGKDWKPVCFGNWYKKRIVELLKDSNEPIKKH
ncbi:MAG: hypothetical protein WA584_20950 [Pyrinomonadaceae bacterium]